LKLKFIKNLVSFLFLVSSFLLNAQESQYVLPNFLGKNLQSIENNLGWKTIQKAIGDLNKDGFEDFALILESADSIFEKRCNDCKILKNKARIILVLFNKNDSLIVAIQNNKFIARSNEGGMLPYLEPELKIENGKLIIYYQYTRSNQSYTFEWKSNQLLITSAESNDIHATTGNYKFDSFDFKKDEIITRIGNISEEDEKTNILKFSAKPKSLSEFGYMYDWKIIENKFL